MISTLKRHGAATLRTALCCGIASLALVGGQASAEDATPERNEGPITTSQDIVVLGGIAYRNRVETSEPTLQYGTEYFQRFEPLTAGDALKRVPSVTFLSDVIESDGARLRGLPPGYTQILINGERVPGSSADRSFFLDRIPAELISRVEIIRSSSARRTGDAVAGSLNIVLRDGYELDGGYIRAGTLYYDDEEFEPSVGAVFGGQVGPGRLLLGANLQGRHNPKIKQSLRYGDSPENNPDYATEDFDNREDQTDTRDGKDYSFNGTYEIDGADTNFKLSGFYVRTDRTETERSFEYDNPTVISGPVPTGNLLTDNANVAEIDQESYSFDGKLSHEWSLGKTSVRVGYAKFDEKRNEDEFEVGFDDGGDPAEFEGELTINDITDEELSAKFEHEFSLTDGINFVFGGFLQNKDRKTTILEADEEDEFGELATTWDQFSNNPTALSSGLDPELTALANIEEDRRDVFALVEGKQNGLSWEIGVRYETTDVTIRDLTDPADIVTEENDYDYLLPSASFKLDLTSRDRIIGSVARTARRPDFNLIEPVRFDEAFGDHDVDGNPQLDPELAWGFDLGYERRLGDRGVVGINFFYRDVQNLIELEDTGEIGSNDEAVFQPRNVGNGKVYGFEFDLSTDLALIGLPNTGIFGNFSWLDSEITDFIGDRRFNGQSEYVYNFGFIQDVPAHGVAVGATYRKQGAAFDRLIGEEIKTTYGADLEIFVEKRIGDSFTIRAVGSNLLNGRKREVFNKFDNLDDQIARNFDEYELENEKAGPVFQIMARYAF